LGGKGHCPMEMQKGKKLELLDAGKKTVTRARLTPARETREEKDSAAKSMVLVRRKKKMNKKFS